MRRFSEKGQGILETVIALSVIITGLTGALALAINNLASTSDSGRRVVAGNLAREGIEVARNIRDSNWLSGRQWDQGLIAVVEPFSDHTAIVRFREAPSAGEDFWTLDFEPDNLGQSQALLKINNNIYNHDNGENSAFSRLLTLDEICDDYFIITEDEESSCASEDKQKIGIRIIAEVFWREKSRGRQITVEDKLYNWK